jgi:hypothetical protein
MHGGLSGSIGFKDNFYENGVWVSAVTVTARAALRMYRAFLRSGREPLPQPPKLARLKTQRAREPPDV